VRIKVCDVCKKDGVLTECNRYFSVKRRPELKLDVCEMHNAEVKPLSMDDYKRLVYTCKGYTPDMIETMMGVKG